MIKEQVKSKASQVNILCERREKVRRKSKGVKTGR